MLGDRSISAGKSSQGNRHPPKAERTFFFETCRFQSSRGGALIRHRHLADPVGQQFARFAAVPMG